MSLFKRSIIFLSILISLPTCKKGNNNQDNLALAVLALPQPVTVNFSLTSGTTPVNCATVIANAAGSTNFKIRDMRFYIHDVKLLSANGEHPVTLNQDGKWQFQNVALLDFTDGSGSCLNTSTLLAYGTEDMNMSIRGTVAQKTNFTGIEFTVGVPENLNHLDPNSVNTVSPLDISGMFWAWTSGYKFMKFEYVTDAGTGTFHLGSTTCTKTGDTYSCVEPNRFQVRIQTTAFDLASNKVALDLSTMFANATYTGGPPTTYNCMSGTTTASCSQVFPTLGIKHPTDGGGPYTSQTIFSIK